MQVGLLIELSDPVFLAVEAKSAVLEGVLAVCEALFVVVVLAEGALDHMFVAAPPVALPADLDLLLGLAEC